MADESQTQHAIRSIHWREIFPFLNIFRAFRVAVHPSKLVLGLLALLVLYTGGRILDGLWPTGSLANYGEVDAYEKHGRTRATTPFRAEIDETRRANQAWYARRLLDSKLLDKDQPDAGKRVELSKTVAEDFDRQRDVRGMVNYARKVQIDDAQAAFDKEKKDADERLKADKEAAGKQEKQEDKDRLAREADERHATVQHEAPKRHAAAVQAAFDAAHARLDELRRHVPHGIFATFFEYEVQQVDGVVAGVIANNWTGGLSPATAGPDGVVQSTLNFLTVGPAWLVHYHLVYFILFATLFLVVWAVFGGAIARIAAVHVARDEKISVRQALKFSTNKLLSFIFAPIIPLLIVLVIGAALAAGGLLFYLPFGIGPIIAGAVYFLALIAGVVITLVLLGTGGGFNLMYPTVAVEGSDSFDAISRSFSYVFARPWRMLWYTVVAVAYGALTYLFVRFFIWMVLAVTHYFVGWWLFRGTQPHTWYPEIWPTPTLTKLPYDVNFSGLAFTEDIAAFLIMFWNMMLVGLLGAFAISFYFSANTIIYYLMRREVDATELDDVYVEETDDDLADAPPIVSATPATATGGSPVTPVTPVGATSAPGGGASGTAGSASPSGEAKSYAGPTTETPPSSPPSDGGTPPPT